MPLHACWLAYSIFSAWDVLESHVLGLQVRSDGAFTDCARLASNLLIIIDLCVDEEDPVVQVLVAGCDGREGGHSLLRGAASEDGGVGRNQLDRHLDCAEVYSRKDISSLCIFEAMRRVT